METKSEKLAKAIICDSCRQIDFAAIFEGDWSYKSHFLVHSEDCELCAVLTPNEPAGAEFYLDSPINTQYSEWIPPESVLDRPFFEVYTSSSTETFAFAIEQYGPAVFRPWPLQNSPDYDIARAWLADFQTHHSHTQGPTICVDEMQLIDVQHRVVVKARDLIDPHWITLSCWSYPILR